LHKRNIEHASKSKHWRGSRKILAPQVKRAEFIRRCRCVFAGMTCTPQVVVLGCTGFNTTTVASQSACEALCMSNVNCVVLTYQTSTTTCFICTLSNMANGAIASNSLYSTCYKPGIIDFKLCRHTQHD
jgi:hypothetical protein